MQVEYSSSVSAGDSYFFSHFIVVFMNGSHYIEIMGMGIINWKSRNILCFFCKRGVASRGYFGLSLLLTRRILSVGTFKSIYL